MPDITHPRCVCEGGTGFDLYAAYPNLCRWYLKLRAGEMHALGDQAELNPAERAFCEHYKIFSGSTRVQRDLERFKAEMERQESMAHEHYFSAQHKAWLTAEDSRATAAWREKCAQHDASGDPFAGLNSHQQQALARGITKSLMERP